MITFKKSPTGGYDVFYNERWLISKPTGKAAYRWSVLFMKHVADWGNVK
jgi:hypothetical protein